MKRFIYILVLVFGLVGFSPISHAAYPTTTEHHKLYPYTSVMASPYACDNTGVLDIAASIELIKANQSNVGTIYFPHGTYKLATNLTIPAGIRIEREAGAKISIATGVVLTFNGDLQETGGPFFVLNGTGTVDLSNSLLGALNPKLIGTTEASLKTVAALAVSTGKQLVIDQDYSITADYTLAANTKILPGCILTIATGVTLTINGTLDAGSYQIFSCTGTGSVAGLKTCNAAWFGLDDGGSTDNLAAFNSAFAATVANGTLTIPQPAVAYALSDTWLLNKPVRIIGEGISSVPQQPLTPIASGLKGVTLKRIGASTLAMVFIGPTTPATDSGGVTGFAFNNFSLDCNSIANYGLYIDRGLQGEVDRLSITNPTLVCLRVGSDAQAVSSLAPDDNSSWITFKNLELWGPTGIEFFGQSYGNACHNTFIQTRIGFTGAYGIIVNFCDNNSFYNTFVYRLSGTGYGLHFMANSNNNYFYHLQAPGISQYPATAIEGLSKAAACVVTWTGHGLSTGDTIRFAGITQDSIAPTIPETQWPLLNSINYPITWINANSFSIPVNTSGYTNPYNPATDPGTVQAGKSILVDASTYASTIFGYDMSNGQVYPTLANSSTSLIAYYSQGLGAYGDYAPRHNMQGDIFYTTLNGEAMKWEDYNTGNKFKFLLNPTTRRFEAWKADAGTYVKVFEFNATDLRIGATAADINLYMAYPGGGIRLTTPDGTQVYKITVANGTGAVTSTLVGAPY